MKILFILLFPMISFAQDTEFSKKDTQNWALVSIIGHNEDTVSVKNSKNYMLSNGIECDFQDEYTKDNIKEVKYKRAVCNVFGKKYFLSSMCMDGSSSEIEGFKTKGAHLYLKCN